MIIVATLSQFLHQIWIFPFWLLWRPVRVPPFWRIWLRLWEHFDGSCTAATRINILAALAPGAGIPVLPAPASDPMRKG